MNVTSSDNIFYNIFFQLAFMGARMKERDKKRLEQFRENLIRLREERQLSQRGLSYICDVTHSKISRLESNPDSNLSLTTLFELARGLGVHPKELIDYKFDF
ncbi:helix-turn-helix domain-containing protein [Fulvivirga ligni]|uniref:helix-turn-helix domain-containing protein n=1 Tax=Fulvivirga ligni TaxID=2904246 RepID=UPI001F1B591B|nr:helix-turn-helix transcriptional regulator [Fulvivirga ligni]UII20854.1 helix-turn-helix domain-containing protein [Fulvivirga ligni]